MSIESGNGREVRDTLTAVNCRYLALHIRKAASGEDAEKLDLSTVVVLFCQALTAKSMSHAELRDTPIIQISNRQFRASTYCCKLSYPFLSLNN